MAYRIFASNSYFYILDDVTNVLNEGLVTEVLVRRGLTSSTEFSFNNVNGISKTLEIEFADIKDQNGNAYADIDTFIQFYEKATKNNVIDVAIQDQTTALVNEYFTKQKGAATTTTADVAIGDISFDVTDATNYAAGDYISVYNATSERYFYANVLSVATNTINIDTPFDFAFPSGSASASSSNNLAVNGAVTPQIFEVGSLVGIDIDITRIIFTMTLTTAGDDGLFGNIAKLTKGLVLRKKDGIYRNIFNVKDNGELAGYAFDLTYTTRSGGTGVFGLRCRYTFAGQDKQGVTVRLTQGESLQLIVQDDLTGIERFRVLAEGHEVER